MRPLIFGCEHCNTAFPTPKSLRQHHHRVHYHDTSSLSSCSLDSDAEATQPIANPTNEACDQPQGNMSASEVVGVLNSEKL